MFPIFYNRRNKMPFIITLLELFPNLVEAGLFVYIISNCLQLRFEKNRIFLIVILHFFVITSLALFVTKVPIRILSLLGIEILFTILCTKRTLLSLQLFYGSVHILFSIIAENLVIFSSELLIGYPLESIYDNSMIRFWLIFLYLLLHFLFSFMMVTIKKQSLMFPKPLLFFFLLGIIFAVISIEILFHVMISLEKADSSFDVWPLQIIGLGFLLMIFVLVFCVVYIGQLYEKNLSLTEQKKQILLEQNQLETLQKANSFLRIWKHDFKNHLQTLAQMLHTENYQSCKQYIENITNEVQYARENLYTHNPVVDAVLSIKFLEIQAKQISFTHEIFLPSEKQLPLNDVKLSSILNNIFDNAIEACQQMEQGAFIHFSMKHYNSQFLIQMNNSSNGRYEYDSEMHLRTTKTEQNHGNGLKRIQNLLEEAGGICNISPESEQFTITILLPYKD